MYIVRSYLIYSLHTILSYVLEAGINVVAKEAKQICLCLLLHLTRKVLQPSLDKRQPPNLTRIYIYHTTPVGGGGEEW